MLEPHWLYFFIWLYLVLYLLYQNVTYMYLKSILFPSKWYRNSAEILPESMKKSALKFGYKFNIVNLVIFISISFFPSS